MQKRIARAFSGRIRNVKNRWLRPSDNIGTTHIIIIFDCEPPAENTGTASSCATTASVRLVAPYPWWPRRESMLENCRESETLHCPIPERTLDAWTESVSQLMHVRAFREPHIRASPRSAHEGDGEVIGNAEEANLPSDSLAPPAVTVPATACFPTFRTPREKETGRTMCAP